MAGPFLSVIVPAFNEESRIGQSLAELKQHLSTKSYEWEIVVSDDGSTDRTAAIVEEFAGSDPRIRLLSLRHGGKGWAIRNGMLESQAEWRFMCDADLSMPAEQIDRFFENDAAPAFDIGVGSREVTGSRRIGEPWRRHFIGRIYNYATRIFTVRGISDTQCGFKLYRGEVAESIFGAQTLEGWGFDVEVLYLGRKIGSKMREVPIDWYYRTESKVNVVSGAMGFVDILRVRWNDVRGMYADVRDEVAR